MKDIDDTRAPLLDHLVELRKRLLWSIAAIFLCFPVCFFFAEDIFRLLAKPLADAGQERIIYTEIFEAFLVKVKIGFFGALMIAFPVLANQIWKFVAPGLYAHEKRAILPFLLATPFLFTAGALFAYFVAVPIALRFLLGFQGPMGGVTQEALPAIGSYLSFIMQFLFAFGVAFLLPVFLVLLERSGIVSVTQLRDGRRYFIVAAFVLAAVLTPPDVVSQLLLAIPLCLLYEISLILIRFTRRRESTKSLPGVDKGQELR